MFYFHYMFVGMVNLYVLLSYMFVGLVDLYVLLSLHVCRTGGPVCFTFITCL